MIILRQKEFVNPSYRNHKQKKEVDKKRKEELVSKRTKSLEKVYKRINNQKPVLNPEVERNIISSRNDTFVLRDPGRRIDLKKYGKDDYSTVFPREVLDIQKRELEFEKNYLSDKEKESEKEINLALNSGKDKFIRYAKDNGIDSLSHEFGHLKNVDNKYPKSNIDEFTDKDSLKDERQASINAVGILKNAGATKKEIKQSKKNLRDFEKTYRLTNKIKKGGKEDERN